MHTPIKESGDYCALVDIMSSGQSVHGDHMNVLVAVKSVSIPICSRIWVFVKIICVYIN